RDAAITGGVIFLVTRYSAPSLLHYTKSRVLALATGCVVFHTGSLVLDILFANERQEKHMVWSRLWEPYEPIPHLNALDALLMLGSNTLLNSVLVWYLDSTRPAQCGTPQPFWFAFTRKYWMASKNSSSFFPVGLLQSFHKSDLANDSLTAIIQIRGLVKVVDGPFSILGTDLDMFAHQVSVMAGPAGAGKTTTLNMLTGLEVASGGSAYINGSDIKLNTAVARASLSLCPNHDTLFDQLTCGEHLEFYSMLRSRYQEILGDNDIFYSHIDKEQKKAEMSALLEDLGLAENVPCKSLNTSDRQKLAIACSFVEDCRAIFLDEPFEALDTPSKREVQKFLHNKKMNKAIVVTTRHIDEAEETADRIIIIVKGVIKASGSLGYLQGLFGIGYHINLAMETDYDVNEVSKVIHKGIVSNPEPDVQNETELRFRIAEDYAKLLPAILRDLENQRVALKIKHLSLNSNWLKDVYTRFEVGLEEKQYWEEEISESRVSIFDDLVGIERFYRRHSDALSHGSNKLAPEEVLRKVHENLDFHHLKHFPLLAHQLQAIFLMKLILFCRGRRLSALQLLLPFALTLLGRIIDGQAGVERTKSDPLYFTPSSWRRDLVFPVFYEKFDRARLVMEYILEVHEVYGQIEEFKYSSSSFNGTIEEFANLMLNDLAKERTIPLYKELVQYGLVKLVNSPYIIVYYRNASNHSDGIAMQLALNAWVKCSLGSEFSVQSGVQLHPRPYEDMVDRFPRRWTTFFFLSISMAVVPLPFMYRLVLERASGTKQLESMNGVRPYDYCRGHFLFDFVLYYLMVVPVMVVLFLSGLTNHDQTLLTIIILTVFGLTMIEYLYALHFFFLKPMVAAFVVFMINMVIGVTLSTYVVSSALKGKTGQEFILFIGVTVSISTPNFPLTGFLYLLTIQPSNFLFPVDTEIYDASTFFCHPISFIYCLLFQLLVFWTVVAFFEFKVDKKIRCLLPTEVTDDVSPIDFLEDVDVKTIRNKIDSAHKSNLILTYSLVMKNLKKQYRTDHQVLTAVHNFSFGMYEKDCLGLLGPQDAGKTTVCQMITGEVNISYGQVHMNGLNVMKHPKRTQTMIGYCPQHDDMPDQLTGREALYMFARLGGVPRKVLPKIVQNTIDLTSMSPYEDQLIKTYSSGFKRRVSVAIAIIGSPKFILLDEPTEGLDTQAKHMLWEVFQNLRKAGKTLILATRSIEECVTVCTHMAVMVKGHTVCLGAPERLKQKFSKGYTVTLYAMPSDIGGYIDLTPAEEFVLDTFHGSKLFAKSESYVDILVPEAVPPADVIDSLESALNTLNFQRYKIQHTTFEQMLLKFMKTD
ncbi:ATP-binding cassette sub-family A member 2, partial [Biomphalaria glabrata]